MPTMPFLCFSQVQVTVSSELQFTYGHLICGFIESADFFPFIAMVVAEYS